MTIGERIKSSRIELNITQEELARYIGSTKQTIHKYETGIISNIPLNKLSLIATKLKTTPAYLMGWEDYPFQLKETAEREIETRKSMVPIEDVNLRLKQAIEKKNMGILELSQKTSISENALRRYLSGGTRPNEDNIYILSKTLEVSQDWLRGYDVPMEAKYYSKDYELSAAEESIILIFRNLNKLGQDRLLEYSMELNEISKYILKK